MTYEKKLASTRRAEFSAFMEEGEIVVWCETCEAIPGRRFEYSLYEMTAHIKNHVIQTS